MMSPHKRHTEGATPFSPITQFRKRQAWRVGRACATRPGATGQSQPSHHSTEAAASSAAPSALPVLTPEPQPVALQPLKPTLPSSTEQGRSDLTRAATVAAIVAVLALVTESNKEWIAAHQEMMVLIVFSAGYAGIIVEDFLGLNKAGVALLMAAALWSIRADASPDVLKEIGEAVGDVSGIVYFLIGAMTIVETIDAHQGFKLVTDVIKPASRTALLWIVGWLAFFLAAVLDNLTTTIVMVSLLQKLCPEPVRWGLVGMTFPYEGALNNGTRRYMGAVVVLASNAGGAWTPIGDVTTTMLWAGGALSTAETLRGLFLPSAVSLLLPMALMTALAPEAQGPLPASAQSTTTEAELAPRGKLVLSVGLGALLAVPVFKSVTGLPPYVGMLAGLGFLWLFVDALHYGEARKGLRVSSALQRIDSESVLFFLGILMAVASLEATGTLRDAAQALDAVVGRPDAIAAVIGVASAVVDNVPLVAATQGMYSLDQMIAYAAGTGGSMLIIGSAAGVAYMGMEGASFGWYLARVTPFAVAGYIGGFATYLTLHAFSGL